MKEQTFAKQVIDCRKSLEVFTAEAQQTLALLLVVKKFPSRRGKEDCPPDAMSQRGSVAAGLRDTQKSVIARGGFGWL